MKTEFRNRAFLPVVIPLGIVLTIAVTVGCFALILLYNTKETALVVALVSAAGILTAVALAASQDELEGPKRAAVFAAGIVPVIAGAVFSVASANGLVDASALNINRQPHTQVPEDAVIAATSLESFCLPTEDGGCEDTREWSVTGQGAEQFLFEFDNRQQATPHNVGLFTLSDQEATGQNVTPDSGGDQLFIGDVITGPDQIVYDAQPGLDPGKYFFQCAVHPSTMIGVLTVTEGGGEGQ